MVVHIELDSPPGSSYFAGDVVSGRVVILASRYVMAYKEIEILIVGRERIQLHPNLDPITANIIENVRILKTSTQPCHFELDSMIIDGFSLSEETFVYPFQFHLPRNLPSSFETPQGQVFYLLEAKMKPIFSEDDRILLPFIVNGILDLNNKPEAQQPQECLRIKRPNLFVGRWGKIGISLDLPLKSGFVPGELLEFDAVIINKSNRDVLGMTASLLQVIRYNGSGKYGPRSEVTEEVFNPVHGPEVEKGQQTYWKPTELVIPEVPPSGLGLNCGLVLIEVQYFLHFEMEISGLSKPFFTKLPILIGNVPLVSSSLAPEPSAPTEEDQPSAPVETDIEESTDEDDLPESGEIYMNPPTYEDVAGAGCSLHQPFIPDHISQQPPPPSYEESITVDGENLEEDES